MKILVATWSQGLLALNGQTPTQELSGQPVRGLTTDGRGGALAIVAHHSLQQRTPDGQWKLVADSALSLACCVAVGDQIYVGTETAQVLRVDHGAFELLDSFDRVPGRDKGGATSFHVPIIS